VDIDGIMGTHFVATHAFDALFPIHEGTLFLSPSDGFNGAAFYTDSASQATLGNLGMIEVELFESIT